MTQGRFLLFNLIYATYIAIWLAALLGLLLVLHASWVVKSLGTVVLVAIAPTLDGPWRYRSYRLWWDGLHSQRQR